MRETFDLLGRRMTVLDLTRPRDGDRSGTVATNWRLPARRGGWSVAGRPSPPSALPLRWLMGDGVRLDLREQTGDVPVEVTHCRAQLDRAGYRLKPYDIVLCHVSEASNGEERAVPILTPTCVTWMLEQGVRVIGSNATSTARDLVHSSVRERSGASFCSLDGLCNLDRLPGLSGFTVMAFPVDDEDPASSTSRVVALFDGV